MKSLLIALLIAAASASNSVLSFSLSPSSSSIRFASASTTELCVDTNSTDTNDIRSLTVSPETLDDAVSAVYTITQCVVGVTTTTTTTDSILSIPFGIKGDALIDLTVFGGRFISDVSFDFFNDNTTTGVCETTTTTTEASSSSSSSSLSCGSMATILISSLSVEGQIIFTGRLLPTSSVTLTNITSPAAVYRESIVSFQPEVLAGLTISVSQSSFWIASATSAGGNVINGYGVQLTSAFTGGTVLITDNTFKFGENIKGAALVANLTTPSSSSSTANENSSASSSSSSVFTHNITFSGNTVRCVAGAANAGLGVGLFSSAAVVDDSTNSKSAFLKVRADRNTFTNVRRSFFVHTEMHADISFADNVQASDAEATVNIYTITPPTSSSSSSSAVTSKISVTNNSLTAGSGYFGMILTTLFGAKSNTSFINVDENMVTVPTASKIKSNPPFVIMLGQNDDVFSVEEGVSSSASFSFNANKVFTNAENTDGDGNAIVPSDYRMFSFISYTEPSEADLLSVVSARRFSAAASTTNVTFEFMLNEFLGISIRNNAILSAFTVVAASLTVPINFIVVADDDTTTTNDNGLATTTANEENETTTALSSTTSTSDDGSGDENATTTTTTTTATAANTTTQTTTVDTRDPFWDFDHPYVSGAPAALWSAGMSVGIALVIMMVVAF